MLTAQQRADRRRFIGSSDSPAILGVDTFRTAGDVYWSKKVVAEEEEKPAFEVGNRLESVILDWCQDKIGKKIERDLFLTHHDLPYHCANLDGMVIAGGPVVEAKYSSQYDEWGADGSDEIPDRVMIQVQHQMGVARVDRALVPALIVTPRAAEFRLYSVGANADLAASVFESGNKFWTEHVLKNVPPPDAPIPPFDVLRRIRRAQGTVVELSDSLFERIAEWEAARKLAGEAKKASEAATARLLAELGENEVGIFPDGTQLRYVQEGAQRQVDFDKLIAMSPEAYAECVSPGSRRVLRVKRVKAKK